MRTISRGGRGVCEKRADEYEGGGFQKTANFRVRYILMAPYIYKDHNYILHKLDNLFCYTHSVTRKTTLSAFRIYVDKEVIILLISIQYDFVFIFLMI